MISDFITVLMQLHVKYTKVDFCMFKVENICVVHKYNKKSINAQIR